MSAVTPDGTYFNNYYDLERLEAHLKELSPEDGALIDEYIAGIKGFMDDDRFSDLAVGSLGEKLRRIPFVVRQRKSFMHTLGSFGRRFKHPLLRKAFPLMHTSLENFPLFLQQVKHAYALKGDLGWPRGGSVTVARNMAERYSQLGGTIHYRKKVVKILTDNDRACGVELEDGTQHKVVVGEESAMGSMFGFNQRYTLPGLRDFFFAGSWATSAGSLFMNALSGKHVVQRICRQSGVGFKEPSQLICDTG